MSAAQLSPSRILILRLSSLGDLTLLFPIFEEIKKAYPQIYLACLVKPQYRELVAESPFLDEVFVFDGFFSTLSRLSRFNWDAVLDLHAVSRTRFLMFFLKTALKITYRKDVWRRRLMLWLGPREGKHTLERYRDALKYLGIGLKRIVVFQTALLGDAVLTIPLLRQLRERFHPQCLDIIARPQHAFLFAREGFSVIEDEKTGSGWSLTQFLAIRNKLAAARYDGALLPHRSLRSALLAFAARIPLRIGFSNSSGWFLCNRRVSFAWPEHDSERNLKLLEALPLRAPAKQEEKTEFEIHLRREDEEKARHIWASFGLDPAKEFLIGLAPGASRVTKRWLSARFAQLGLKLKERRPQTRIVLIGAAHEKELCDQVAALIGEGALNLAGKLALSDLLLVLKNLRLFVTNDSGPMHMASGLGVPTVAIFGPTVRGFGFYPKGVASRLIEVPDLACRPCGLHGGRVCPRGHFLCMRLVTVDQVLDACESVMAK